MGWIYMNKPLMSAFFFVSDLCVWNEWGEWSPCREPCSGGFRSRWRHVYHPMDVTQCQGARFQSESCNTAACPGKCPENWNLDLVTPPLQTFLTSLFPKERIVRTAGRPPRWHVPTSVLVPVLTSGNMWNVYRDSAGQVWPAQSLLSCDIHAVLYSDR